MHTPMLLSVHLLFMQVASITVLTFTEKKPRILHPSRFQKSPAYTAIRPASDHICLPCRSKILSYLSGIMGNQRLTFFII